MAGMWGLIVGFVVGVTRLSAKVFYSNDPTAAGSWFKSLFYDTNWLFFCGGMLVFCMIAIIIISMFTKPASAEQIKGLTFSSSTPEQRAATRASWTAWDVIHSCIIVAITIAFYVYFW